MSPGAGHGGSRSVRSGRGRRGAGRAAASVRYASGAGPGGAGEARTAGTPARSPSPDARSSRHRRQAGAPLGGEVSDNVSLCFAPLCYCPLWGHSTQATQERGATHKPALSDTGRDASYTREKKLRTGEGLPKPGQT